MYGEKDYRGTTHGCCFEQILEVLNIDLKNPLTSVDATAEVGDWEQK